MEFSLSDIFAVRDGFDGWEAFFLVIENLIILTMLAFAFYAIKSANNYRRHKKVEDFVDWNKRPVGGPILFPTEYGIAACVAGWIVITYSSLRIFELPVLGIVGCVFLILSAIALYRRSSLRRLYDDPFHNLANVGIEHETRHWWEL